MKKTGGCNCGAIRYQLVGEPLFVHVCHCTECQRDSGGAFNVTMLLLENDFHITEGVAAQKIICRKSGNRYYGYFCEGCGNPIYGMPVQSTGLMVLRPGSLDDSSWWSPQAHIWATEKQSWISLPTTVPCFEKEYDLYDLWPADSIRRLQTLDSVKR